VQTPTRRHVSSIAAAVRHPAGHGKRDVANRRGAYGAVQPGPRQR